MIEQKEKKYSGYGYHGGGRKATGIKRVSICISGQPEQIEELKKMAKFSRQRQVRFLFMQLRLLCLLRVLMSFRKNSMV